MTTMMLATDERTSNDASNKRPESTTLQNSPDPLQSLSLLTFKLAHGGGLAALEVDNNMLAELCFVVQLWFCGRERFWGRRALFFQKMRRTFQQLPI